ncbi:MAG TPA: F0F1 ATP synthase subunit delta [Ornithinimicrobium sp.]|uniref:F0F1 ATP synthase subunit delta n=1 Tax=Ornithinimicrobium sp. TaxID=1977084 RepID=UPI002B4787DD|nr:F0F1 ATP synthase subunit delta [Ornithinimicrobium sp.]HKJ12837.1 F0F1 ATP synthase subunit delta [Ornithinimicrobium sp.]
MSRGALTSVRESLEETLRAEDVDAAGVGEDLLAVSGVLGGSAVLRRALTDPSRTGRDRGKLVDRLFAGRVSDGAQRVTRAVVAERWARNGHLTVALETLAVQSFLAHAETHGRLTQVEDELFRFKRIAQGSPELQSALSDARAPDDAKGDLVKALLQDRAAPETVRLVSHAVASATTRFDESLESYLMEAAERQSHLTAVVTSASALTEDQYDRVAAALSQQYGRDIHVNAVIDPDVLGGVRVEIGDEVIEGTISNRLAQARRSMTR